MKLAINVATRGRPELLKATVEETLKNIRHDSTRLMISIDRDDEATIAISHEIKSLSERVDLCIWPREDTLGAKYNRVVAAYPLADVFLAMVDYAPHIIPGFDEKILEAASLFEDGIGVVYNHMANLSFPQINAVTRGLVEQMGHFYVPYFPYWFLDHWLDDIARMIGRIAVTDVWVDCSKRPGTMDRREPGFWATFYDAGYLERRRIAKSIIDSPKFKETEARKRILVNGFPLIDERSVMVNNEVRNTAAAWAAAVTPEAIDERYKRVRAAAVERLKGYVAEIEAEEATVAVNRKAA